MKKNEFDKEITRLSGSIERMNFVHKTQFDTEFELYKKIGFVEIGRIDNMTEYNGKWWQDIRMEKDFE